MRSGCGHPATRTHNLPRLKNKTQTRTAGNNNNNMSILRDKSLHKYRSYGFVQKEDKYRVFHDL